MQAQLKNPKYQFKTTDDEEFYYHDLDKAEQDRFDQFLLDQRAKEGRIIKKLKGLLFFWFVVLFVGGSKTESENISHL